MNAQIIVTKNCSHCHNLSEELNNLDIQHEILYAEDHPKL